MINIAFVMIAFILVFMISFLTYNSNPKNFIVYHKYSTVVDVLAWISGLFIVITSIQISKTLQNYDLVLWTQVIIGLSVFNIHLSRFIIRRRTR